MRWKVWFGLLVMGMIFVRLHVLPTYGAEFSLSILSTGATSREFSDPLYVPDGWFDVSVLDDSCIWWLYDVYAFPVDNSAPDSSTPPTNSPLNGYKDQPSNFYQAFWWAGVGTYRIEVTQLLDIEWCTLDNVLEAFVDIRDAYVPPPPSEEEPGGGWWTWDEGSWYSGEVIRGAASSIQFFFPKSEENDVFTQQDEELKDTPDSLSEDWAEDQDDLIQPKEVCSDKKTLLVRRYQLLNATQDPVYDLPLAKKLTVKIRIERLLEKHINRTERNDAILSVMCVLEEKRVMHWSADGNVNNGNGLIAFLQDVLVLAYEHE